MFLSFQDHLLTKKVSICDLPLHLAYNLHQIPWINKREFQSGRWYIHGVEKPIEPKMGPSLADVLLCTFESTYTGFSSFPVRRRLGVKLPQPPGALPSYPLIQLILVQNHAMKTFVLVSLSS